MTTRDKLSNFLYEYKIDSPYFNNIEELADALIDSGLVVDKKVYKPKSKKDYIDEKHGVYNWQINCSKCGYDLTRGYSNYCPTCGCKLKEINND